MNLPPLPETHLKNKVEKFYTAADMHFYGELCIKEYTKHLREPRKFTPSQVEAIRNLRAGGDGYKLISRIFPMNKETYFNIVMNRGAYK